MHVPLGLYQCSATLSLSSVLIQNASFSWPNHDPLSLSNLQQTTSVTGAVSPQRCLPVQAPCSFNLLRYTCTSFRTPPHPAYPRFKSHDHQRVSRCRRSTCISTVTTVISSTTARPFSRSCSRRAYALYYGLFADQRPLPAN
jgi:hypothetical protein